MKYNWIVFCVIEIHLCVKYFKSLKITLQPVVVSSVVGSGGALIESIAFNRRVVGSTPALAATILGKSLINPQLPVTLRHETPAQYPCCVGSATEWKWT